MVRILTDSMRHRVMDVLGRVLYRTLTEDDSCPCCGYGYPVRKFCERCDGDLADADMAKGSTICRACDWRGGDEPPDDSLGIARSGWTADIAAATAPGGRACPAGIALVRASAMAAKSI